MAGSGQTVRVRVHFAPERADPQRDIAHRRVAQQTNAAFQAQENNLNALLSALNALIQANNLSGWTPPEWE